MASKRVADLRQAIGELTQEELEELRLWLDEYAGVTAFDQRIEADLPSGRLDHAVRHALDDEKDKRTGPL
jgi:hypothetical protein